ncbi:MAG: ATP-binding protein, partial [Hydrogenimonas sp.]|nr:ATP-binding protein [Hydrogenimonas sp.]
NVEREEFDLSEIVEESVAKMEEMANEISIKYEPMKYPIYADRRGCQKAIDNLVANAVKYNRPGGEVKIYMRNGWLSIEDSGIGMDETTLFNIFDRYYQSDLSASGYGIGLHIVKTFCDEHAVEIKIDSKIGIGTTFRLNFAAVGEKD